MNLLSFSILLFSVVLSRAELSTVFEFEDVVGGPSFARAPWRSNASGNASLHMFEGDKIVLKMCLIEPVVVTIENFTFSNDGISDLIELAIDNEPFTNISTFPTTGGFGHFWDIFKTIPGVGSKELSTGEHNLTLKVLSADCYGSEFDSIGFSTNVHVKPSWLVCGAVLVKSQTPSLCAQIIDATTTISPPAVPEEAMVSAETKTVSPVVQTDSKPTPSKTSSTTLPFSTSSVVSSTVPSTAASSTTLPFSTSSVVSSTVPSTAASSTTLPFSTSSVVSSTVPSTAAVSSGGTEAPTDLEVEVSPYNNPSFCLGPDNVNFVFLPPSINNLKINLSAEAASRSLPDSGHTSSHTDGPRECGDEVWAAGRFDSNNADLGPVSSDEHIIYEVYGASNNLFPGVVNPVVSKEITVRYKATGSNDKGKGRPFITIGVFNISSPTTLGFVFDDATNRGRGQGEGRGRSKGRGRGQAKGRSNNAESHGVSSVVHVTFSPGSTIKTIDVPVNIVSRSGEAEFDIVFDDAYTALIYFDFIRIDKPKDKLKLRRHLIANQNKWTIIGRIATEASSNQGFDVFVDGLKKQNDVFKFIVVRQPNNRLFSIDRNGQFSLEHTTDDDAADADQVGYKRSGSTSLKFGSLTNHVTKVDFNTDTGELTVTYSDNTFIQLRISVSTADITIDVIDNNLVSAKIFYLSDNVAEDPAGATQLSVDDQTLVNVQDKNTGVKKGRQFRFLRRDASTKLVLKFVNRTHPQRAQH